MYVVLLLFDPPTAATHVRSCQQPIREALKARSSGRSGHAKPNLIKCSISISSSSPANKKKKHATQALFSSFIKNNSSGLRQQTRLPTRIEVGNASILLDRFSSLRFRFRFAFAALHCAWLSLRFVSFRLALLGFAWLRSSPLFHLIYLDGSGDVLLRRPGAPVEHKDARPVICLRSHLLLDELLLIFGRPPVRSFVRSSEK